MENNFEEINKIIKSKKIQNKKEYYLLYENEFFGNKALTWGTYEEILQSGWKGKVCIRSQRIISGKNKVIFNIPLENLQYEIKKLEEKKILRREMTFNQSMPDDKLLLQGEVMRQMGEWELLYTTVKKPMNRALEEESLSARGLKAREIIKTYFNPSSYSDLEALMEIFPDSVVEFGCYSINIGNIPSRNVVIWEVRNY